ncbi:MAG TPA: HD domain-containing protein [Gemmatimonadaceae bacterium]|jgi:2-amino-4-hydroxy-6-hydroxymethyldihydropteridine diphosphokinase
MTEREVTLPSWAQVGDKRRKHIGRVVGLLDEWAEAMHLSSEERADWRAAGIHHDALRDAPEDQLRHLANDPTREVEILHGPAVATLLAAKGGFSPGVLSAIRYHTVGSPEWDRTGKALFMADFLEPGRNFARRDRAFLASQVPTDFDGVFRQVLRARLEHSLREGFSLFPETVDLWNVVR